MKYFCNRDDDYFNGIFMGWVDFIDPTFDEKILKNWMTFWKKSKITIRFKLESKKSRRISLLF